jgi:type IV pilus assembly protein PilO
MKTLARPIAPGDTASLRQNVERWLTPLNLHWAGLGLLAVLYLYLLLQLGLAWQRAHSQNEDAFARQQVALKTAQIASQPLQGLDVKLANSTIQAAGFYQDRLANSYSEVVSELGDLARKQHVALARVQYAQSAVQDSAAGQLTEVRMDASLSGDYRSLVLFINHMERDKLFFLISGITLTGQQTGQVNLRLKVTTYLHGAVATDATGTAAAPVPASDGGGQ